jgi:hypothetical protein
VGSPAGLLRREAESWCDYVGYVQGQIDQLEEQVAASPSPSRTSGQRQLAAARADWAAARTAWDWSVTSDAAQAQASASVR